MKYYCDRHPGIKLEIILVAFPCYHSQILKQTEDVLAKYNKPASNVRGGSEPAIAVGVTANERVRMLVIDSIASTPGVQYPWEELVSLCHKYGVFSLVDAAHSIGQHHVDMKKADPDFFISNCHKWLMT
jgi:kynureninase